MLPSLPSVIVESHILEVMGQAMHFVLMITLSRVQRYCAGCCNKERNGARP